MLHNHFCTNFYFYSPPRPADHIPTTLPERFCYCLCPRGGGGALPVLGTTVLTQSSCNPSTRRRRSSASDCSPFPTFKLTCSNFRHKTSYTGWRTKKPPDCMFMCARTRLARIQAGEKRRVRVPPSIVLAYFKFIVFKKTCSIALQIHYKHK